MRKSFRRALCGIFALLMCSGLSACGPSPNDGTPPEDDEQGATNKTEVADLDKYDGAKYLEPVWLGDRVYAETAMLLKGEDGKLSDIELYYPVTEIVAVRSYTLDRKYEEGRDYVLCDGKIRIPEGSALYSAACDYDLYYQPNYIDGVNWAQVTGGAQLRTEAQNGEPGLTRYQIAVTYRHESAFGGDKPAGKSSVLPHTNEKLVLGEKLGVVCLGDSISAGWSASGYEYVNRKPFTPPYFTQVINRLKEIDPQVRSSNLSVAGMTSDWAASTQIGNITKLTPDLAVIAFGMNDGADKSYTASVYKRNIENVITKVRAVCPDTEFVLVATMLPNAEVGYTPGVSVMQNHENYLPALMELESEYEGVAVADVTGVHRELLTRKAFRDMSTNNINHPNDFMQRVYAQVILTTIQGK